METIEEKAEALLNLANDVMKLSRNTLVVNLRFMDMAISSLPWVIYDGTLSVEGEHILYNPVYVLQSYKKAKELPVRQYLHMVFHCIFQHFSINTVLNERYWNLACDIAVENCINELHLNAVKLNAENEQMIEINNLKTNCKYMTAEMLYRYFLEHDLSEIELMKLERLFTMDDHSIWYMPPEKVQVMVSGSSGSGDSKNSDSQGNGDSDDNNSSGQGLGTGSSTEDISGSDSDSVQQSLAEARAKLKQHWKDISEQMQMDLETFSKKRGNQSGDMMQNLKEVNREKYDYASFLKKFSVMGEAMKINDDEFDYIFYTYGMNLFSEKRMPLIEPLEYKDVKRIKEFVIAIDTSGSVSGELVQKFITKTYNILMNEESYFQKINVHIIQCDAQIQEDHKITSQKEFEEYLKTMKLYGFGGTDFRPVFNYVDELIRNKEFTNLKGMIYFTDGWGTFPNRHPNYETAFVFLDDNYNNPDVPVWAIKVVLRDDEI